MTATEWDARRYASERAERDREAMAVLVMDGRYRVIPAASVEFYPEETLIITVEPTT